MSAAKCQDELAAFRDYNVYALGDHYYFYGELTDSDEQTWAMSY